MNIIETIGLRFTLVELVSGFLGRVVWWFSAVSLFLGPLFTGTIILTDIKSVKCYIYKPLFCPKTFIDHDRDLLKIISIHILDNLLLPMTLSCDKYTSEHMLNSFLP